MLLARKDLGLAGDLPHIERTATACTLRVTILCYWGKLR